MRARRQGRIINVGSMAAWVGEPGEAFYAASKATLARYSEALRHEVWHRGIKVSLVELGTFTTGVLLASSTSTASIPDYDGPRESAYAVLEDALAKGQDPSMVAELIWKVAHTTSPRSRYATGREGSWLPRLKVRLPRPLLDSLLRRGFRLPR
jgi:NAD(P)-dependent dehydrogenase (short-subunit alcohol dehydrogenase family)